MDAEPRPSHLRRAAAAAASRLPLPLLRRLVPRPLLAWYYHVVSAEALPHVRHAYRYKAPDEFAADLDALAESRLLGLDQALEGRAGTLITFDDGFAECFTVVRPLLLARKAPCAFFVVTDCIDNRALQLSARASLLIDRLEGLPPEGREAALAPLRRDLGLLPAPWPEERRRLAGLRTPRAAVAVDRASLAAGVDVAAFLRERRPYLDAEQVRRLAADGFTIGAHGRMHWPLSELGDEAAITAEVVEACAAVRDLTGARQVPFAFPYNGDGVDRALLERIRACHPFVGPFLDTRGLAPDRPFVINRMCGDHPDGAGPGRSNLPHLLRQHFARAARSRVRGRT